MHQLAEQQLLGQWLLQFFLNQTAHRARAIELVIATLGQPCTRIVIELDVHILIGKLQFQL